MNFDVFVYIWIGLAYLFTYINTVYYMMEYIHKLESENKSLKKDLEERRMYGY